MPYVPTYYTATFSNGRCVESSVQPGQWVESPAAAAPALRCDLTRDSDLELIRFLHDERGGPRAAYAWAIGRVPTCGFFKDEFFTADLDTNAVEDFIIKFYTAFNARFGLTY